MSQGGNPPGGNICHRVVTSLGGMYATGWWPLSGGVHCKHKYVASLPRDADYAIARCLFVCPSVCLSVHLSVTRRYSVKTAKDIIKLFSAVAGIHPSKYGNIPTATSITGPLNAMGVWKSYDFRPMSRFISETIRDRAIVTMEGEYETALKLANGAGFNDLEWPLTQMSKSRYYSTLNNPKMVQDSSGVDIQGA